MDKSMAVSIYKPAKFDTFLQIDKHVSALKIAKLIYLSAKIVPPIKIRKVTKDSVNLYNFSKYFVKKCSKETNIAVPPNECYKIPFK